MGKKAVSLVVAVAIAAQPLNGFEVVGFLSIADILLVSALATLASYQILFNDGWIAAGIPSLLLWFSLLMGWLLFAGSGWRLTQYIGFFLLLTLIALFVRDDRDIEVILWGALIGATIAAVLTLYSLFLDPMFGGRVANVRSIGPLPPLHRTIGIDSSFGSFSMFALAPLSFGIIKYWQNRERWLLIPLTTIVASVILVQLRAAYVALIAMFVLLLFVAYGRQMWRASWRNIGLAWIAVSLVVVGGVIGTWALIQIAPDSVTARYDQIVGTIDILGNNPVVGISPPVIEHYSKHIPHNAILLVGAVAGLPAILLLLYILSLAISKLYIGFNNGRTKLIATAVLGGLTANFVSLNFVSGFNRYWWLLIGVSVTFIQPLDNLTTMQERWRSAVNNSKFCRSLRDSLWNSSIFAALTKDSTETRKRLEVAWKTSATRNIFRRLLPSQSTSDSR